jgi:murein DD-endopeptidase MepM/ murein hydrolase activator NlpD
VGAGEVIGLSGNTGRSSAPHLHFEIRQEGKVVDPLSLVQEGT